MAKKGALEIELDAIKQRLNEHEQALLLLLEKPKKKKEPEKAQKEPE